MVYHSAEAAEYTLLLGLLVPFMYLDTAVDSVLKGLGEQVYSMKVNIADAASGLILVLLLTPLLGMGGYILTIWVCEVGNLAASIHRLKKVTGMGLGEALPCYIRPAAAVGILSLLRILFFRKLSPMPAMLLFALFYSLAVIPEGGRIGRKLRKKEIA